MRKRKNGFEQSHWHFLSLLVFGTVLEDRNENLHQFVFAFNELLNYHQNYVVNVYLKVSLTVTRITKSSRVLQLFVHSLLYIHTQLTRNLLLLQHRRKLLLYSDRIRVNRLDVQSHLALNRDLLQQCKTQVNLGNSNVCRVRRAAVETQEKEEESKNSVVSFNTNPSNEVDHLLVNLSVVDGSVDERKRLKKRIDQIGYNNSLVIAVVGLCKGHHEYFINIFDILVVNYLFQQLLFVQNKLLNIPSDHLDVVLHTTKLILEFKHCRLLLLSYLSTLLVILVPAYVYQQIVLVL